MPRRIQGAFLSLARFTDLRSLSLDTELIKFRSFRAGRQRKNAFKWSCTRDEAYFNVLLRLPLPLGHHHPDNVRARCANTRMNLGNALPHWKTSSYGGAHARAASKLGRSLLDGGGEGAEEIGGVHWRSVAISTGINSPPWHRLIPCNWNIFAFRGGRDCNWW